MPQVIVNSHYGNGPFNLQPLFYKSVEKWLEKFGWLEKKMSLKKNNFSRTPFLRFSRKVVAD